MEHELKGIRYQSEKYAKLTTLINRVSEDDELVKTLLAVYRKHSGDFSKPLSMGGGTYARVMKKGVAFGMLYPGEPDVAHQADEFVIVENLVKAAAIYAEAIVKLASK